MSFHDLLHKAGGNPNHDERGRFSEGDGNGDLTPNPGMTEKFDAMKIWETQGSAMWDSKGRMAIPQEQYGSWQEEHGETARRVWNIQDPSETAYAARAEFIAMGGVRVGATATPSGGGFATGFVEVSNSSLGNERGRLVDFMESSPPGARIQFEVRNISPTETIDVYGVSVRRTLQRFDETWVNGDEKSTVFLDRAGSSFNVKKGNPYHEKRVRRLNSILKSDKGDKT
jgi:hypothetical protein